MALRNTLLFLVLVNSISIPCGDAAWPGTFFWKPRLGIDLSVPATEPGVRVVEPTIKNVQDGYVVLINGYEVGLTLVSLVSGYQDGLVLRHLNPGRAWFYTNAWRWAYRHFSMMPFWLGGNGAQYIDTHKAWRRRFFYQDKFIPKWIQKLIFWVPAADWEREEYEFSKFSKYAEPAFGKHYRYPGRVFRDFQSERTEETVENVRDSTVSVSSRYG